MDCFNFEVASSYAVSSVIKSPLEIGKDVYLETTKLLLQEFKFNRRFEVSRPRVCWVFKARLGIVVVVVFVAG